MSINRRGTYSVAFPHLLNFWFTEFRNASYVEVCLKLPILHLVIEVSQIFVNSTCSRLLSHAVKTNFISESSGFSYLNHHACSQ